MGSLLPAPLPYDPEPGVRWMIPPPDGEWVLWYGKGWEYGGPFVRVRYDRSTHTILSIWTEPPPAELRARE